MNRIPTTILFAILLVACNRVTVTPGSKVSVTIAHASDPSVRRTLVEATERIRDYLQRQKPSLDPDLSLSLEELPLLEVWEHMRVQVFRVTEGPLARETFLVNGDTVLCLGTAVGGAGVTSLEVSDLDQDGSAELLFTYGFGSGIHQSRVAMYAPAYGEDQIYEAGTAYHGDMGLLKDDMANVGVRVVELDKAGSILRYSNTLGHLAIQQYGDQVRLSLQVAWNLDDDLRRNLFATYASSFNGR